MVRYEPSEAEGGMADPVPDRGRNEFYFAAWRRAFHLFGVASRTEFWSFTLINLAIFVVLFVVSGWSVPEPDSGDINYLALLLFAFMLVAPVPTLTVAIRRIRDVAGNGWFALLLLLTFTPFAGSVIGTLAGRKLHAAEPIGSDRGYVDVWLDTPDWIGRSSRTEFWSFALINTLAFIGISIVMALLNAATGFPASLFRSPSELGFLDAMLAVGILVYAPMLPLVVRRTRDATGTGWVTTALFPISLVNPFLFVVIMLSPTRDGGQTVGDSGGYWDEWRKAADWGGVAQRGEFWSFTLISLLILSVLGGFALVLYNTLADPYGDFSSGGLILYSFTIFLLVVSYFALTLPWFPLIVRRVRDATGSGWWALTWLIPLVGWMIGLVLFLAPTHDAMSSSLSEPSEEPTSPPDEDTQCDPEDPWQRQQPEPTASNTDQR